MKSIWKWILGIVLVLVVVAVVAAVAFVWRNHVISVSSFRTMPLMPLDRGGDNPMPRDFDRWHHGPVMGHGRGGFGLFGPFLFLGGLVKLVFFGALLYGAYWLGKRNARVVLDPSTQRPAPSPSGTVTESVAAPTQEQKNEENE